MDVYFGVEGGFANQIRSITIGPDGDAEIEVSGSTSQRRLEADVVDAIVAELDGSGLFDRDRTFEAEGADLQRYEIRYAGATVIAHDTSVPPTLTDAIRLLDEALRAAG